jgi:fatty-acid desaturase
MLTHRSFQTSKTVERIFAVAGSLAVQGSVIQWVSDHRKHHAHTDQEGDPHSPHAGFAGGGVLGTLRGLFHAHVGWILTEEGGENRAKYAKDLVEDRWMKRISDNFHWLVLVSLALPSFGEAWHHNHHTFPRSANHGLKRWEKAMDPAGMVIATLEKLGLAWNVVRITPERQREKTLAS